MKEVTAALIALAESNIPVDIQELLIRGDPMRGIPPGALDKAIAAAERQRAQDIKLGRPVRPNEFWTKGL